MANTQYSKAKTQYPKVNAIAAEDEKKELESVEWADFYTPENAKDEFDFSPWEEPTKKEAPIDEQEDHDFLELSAVKEVPEKKPPGGCFGKCFTGKCNAPTSCKYRHDEETLKLTWHFYFDLLKNSPYNANKFRDTNPDTHKPSVLAGDDKKPSQYKRDINQEKGRTFVADVKVLRSSEPQRKVAPEETEESHA
jgi:hypothetical protein